MNNIETIKQEPKPVVQIIKQEPKPVVQIDNISGKKFLTPSNIDETYRIAKALSGSSIVPTQYRGKPDEAFAAIVLGMEIGLPPMRALQSIAVVNGTPCIYGDAQLALVRGSGKLLEFKEYYEGTEDTDDFAAVCTLRREGESESLTERFSVKDAKRAKLWGKSGTWSSHPKRMLKYKARAFILRDTFADVLLGITHSVEEMEEETTIKDITPQKKINQTKSTLTDALSALDQAEV